MSEQKEVGRATERGRRRARARLWVVLSVLALLALALPGQEARAQPTVIATIPVGTGPDGIAVSPDGTKVYVVNSGVSLDVSVIDTTTNTVIATFANPGGNPGHLGDLAFTPDGTEVWVYGGCVGCIRIFSYPSNAPVATVSGIIGEGGDIAFLPDGSFAFANNGCGQCGNLQKISTTSNSVVSTLFHGGGGDGLAVAPDGSAVYAGSGLFAPPQIKRIDPSSFSVTGSVLLPVSGFAITPDGGFLYVATNSPDQVVVVDTSNMTVIGSPIMVGTSPRGVSISPDGSRVYVVNITTADVSVIDTATNTVVATVAVGNHPERAAISADGTRIYVTNRLSNTVSVIEDLVDVTDPTVTITTPPDGAVYLLGQVVLADYACADEAGGSGLASCVGDVPDGTAIDTGSVGPKTFTVDAADNAGNAVSVTHNYSVVYDFSGFFSPVDNPPVVNVAKAGSAIPVKFSLGGNQGLSIFAAGFPISKQINCLTSAPLDGIEETLTAGSSSLSYDPLTDQYVYVWKTKKEWSGTCRQLIVQLNDGTAHVAYFKLK